MTQLKLPYIQFMLREFNNTPTLTDCKLAMRTAFFEFEEIIKELETKRDAEKIAACQPDGKLIPLDEVHMIVAGVYESMLERLRGKQK